MNPGPADRPAGEDREAELEALLGKLPSAAPEPSFREQARREFLGEKSGLAGSRPGEPARTPLDMPEDLPDEDTRFERWLAHELAVPRAREEFRERLQRRFLSGAWAVASTPEDPVIAAPARAPSSFLVRASAVLLAAAAIAAITFFLPSAPRWDVRIQGGGPVRFAGLEYAPGDEQRLAAELERAGSLQTGDAEVTLALGRDLVLRVRKNSTLALPDVPDLAHGDPISLTLETGELHVRTAETYPGNRLAILTREAEVSMHGTVFGVLTDITGTCVCVARGSVSVQNTRQPGAAKRIEAGNTFFLFTDRGHEPESSAFPSGEAADAPEHAHTRDLERFAGG